MTLETIITHYRNRLASLPDAILIGEIPEGAESISPEVLQYITPVHSAFLKLCNGGTFGDIILWSAEEQGWKGDNKISPLNGLLFLEFLGYDIAPIQTD